MVGAGKAGNAEFREAQGQGFVGKDGVLVGGAGVGVDAGGEVDGDDALEWVFPAVAVDQRGHGGDYAVQRAVTPGAEDSVDYQIGAGELSREGVKVGVVGGFQQGYAVSQRGGHFGVVGRPAARYIAADFGPPAAEAAGRHQAVGAVVAGADQHDHPAAGNAAQTLPHPARAGEAGVFHQGVAADAGLFRCGFQCLHLGDADDFDGPGRHIVASSCGAAASPHRIAAAALRAAAESGRAATATAIAKPREWERLMAISVTPSLSARRRARPCRRAPGAPLGARTTSISRQPTPRNPVPRDFITASLAAKRAARLGARPRQ